MIRRLFLLSAFVLVSSIPAAGFSPEARGAFEQGLGALGIGPGELGFHKQWATDSFFRLEAVDHLLDNPLEVAGYVDSFATTFLDRQEDPFALAWLEWLETDVGLSGRDSVRLRQEIERAVVPLPGTEQLPGELGKAVNLVLAGFRVADGYNRAAVAALEDAELDALLGEAPEFWTDEDDSLNPPMRGVLHREFGVDYDTTEEVKAETLLKYVRKVDRRSLALSGLAVVLAASEAERLLREQPVEFPHEVAAMYERGLDGPVLFEAATEFGLVTVGTLDDDEYQRDRCLVIDLSGDDRYRNRAAGAVGTLSDAFSVVLDLGGDDSYHSDWPFGLGAALHGVGVLVDAAGNDVYRSLHYSQGAAILGTGVLVDRGGRDVYTAGCFAQGAGHFGVGLLVDLEGNDSYGCYCNGQAFASTWGYGLLLEAGGNDRYYAGGEYLHEPLLPHEYQSFAQGFAIGWRPDASGGIGFLVDRAGNDFYDGEVFVQATSYWYALGAIWDGGGYDHYLAAQYSQGAGIHLAVGCLVDESGNDSYYSRLGPSQGEGHDLSVGVLVDRGGNDVYHASGGQGTALTNSVGLFADLTGNDIYSSTEKLALAGGRPARGFASIGQFIDLSGRDRYTDGSAGSDGGRWTNGTYGSGQDLTGEKVAGDEADEGDTLETKGDSLALPVDSVFAIASEWEVGNARARVRQARKQLHRLGTVAFDYVFDKKVDTKSGLESRAIEKLCKEWPDTARPYLFDALRHEKRLARNNAAYWLGKMEEDGRPGVDSLLLALRDNRISPRRAAQAFGYIGDSTVVPHILYLLRDQYEPSRIVTAEACGKLRNPVAIPHLIRTLGDRFFTVRSAAEAALGKIDHAALDSLLDAMPGLQTPALGHAVRACGDLFSKLDSVGERELRVRTRVALTGQLENESSFVRLVAVRALEQMLDEPLRRSLEEMRATETDPFVLAELDDLLQD